MINQDREITMNTKQYAISGNRRIAVNTVVVYVRLVITTIIGILSSRFVLQALGASDFGLYSVVGGIVAMFSFIRSSLTTSTRRFINYEVGKPNGNTNMIFNISITIHILFSILLFILMEIVGIWYIDNYLNVDIEKSEDAMFVFQLSVLTTCIGFVTTPFEALLAAFEKFVHIAIIDIVSSIIKLILIFLLFFYNGNVLRFYAVSMSLISIITFFAYQVISQKYWSDMVRWKFVRKISCYKEIFVFNGYNILSSISLVFRNHGSNLLINLFFGTTVNAAYAIANSVQGYVNTFAANFDSATAPQITQSVSGGDRERVSYLVTHTCRFCLLLMELLIIPLYVELEFILRLWLGDNIPNGTVVFCKVTLLVAMVSVSSSGLVRLIHAIGKIKWFSIQISVLYTLSLFGGYIAFKNGFPPYTVIILFIIADALARFNQLLLLRYMYSFAIWDFVKKAYMRPAIVMAFGILYIILYHKMNINGWQSRCLGIFATLIIMAVVVWLVGLYRNERIKILSIIKK